MSQVEELEKGNALAQLLANGNFEQTSTGIWEEVILNKRDTGWDRPLPVTLIVYENLKMDLHRQTGKDFDRDFIEARTILLGRNLFVEPVSAISGSGAYMSVKSLQEGFMIPPGITQEVFCKKILNDLEARYLYAARPFQEDFYFDKIKSSVAFNINRGQPDSETLKWLINNINIEADYLVQIAEKLSGEYSPAKQEAMTLIESAHLLVDAHFKK